MGDFAYLGQSTASSDLSSNTVNVPALAVAGDLLVAWAVNVSAAATVPTGFTSVHTASVSGMYVALSYRVRQAGDPASYAFATGGGFASGDGGTASITAYSGVDPLQPLDDAGVLSSSSSVPIAPSALAIRPRSLYAVALAVRSQSTNATAPSPLVQRFATTGGAPASQSLADLLSVTGSVPGREYVGSASQHVTVTALFRPSNAAPNAPTLTTMASGGIVAAQDENIAAHTHSDPDGDGQTAFRIRYRLDTSTTWTQPADQVTVNQFYKFPAASLTNGLWKRQVATFDGKLWGPWSPEGAFTVATRPAGTPTFVKPINGETIGASSFTVQLSATDFDTLEYRILDAAGAELVGIQSNTTGVFNPSGIANSQTITQQARQVKTSLAGAWTSISNPVSFTPPPTAAPVLSTVLYRDLSRVTRPTDEPVGLRLTPVIPAATGGQPDVQSYAVEREVFTPSFNGSVLRDGVWGDWVGGVLARAATLSPSATFDDLTIGSDEDARYRVRTDASNGTFSLSEWVDEIGVSGVVVVAPVLRVDEPGAELTQVDDFADADFWPGDFD